MVWRIWHWPKSNCWRCRGAVRPERTKSARKGAKREKNRIESVYLSRIAKTAVIGLCDLKSKPH
ncbi:hypothetical protein CNECB9_400001 [Cupriavidus necator]|uniref:Uncharacterized protein n=1 Tax=Cupriavidus necator TaxID=106590 RepID=A0A1K0JET7_CUPNE|nr:hypothetical protein CNECB9_400001 [Cupriavidus necator]